MTGLGWAFVLSILVSEQAGFNLGSGFPGAGAASCSCRAHDLHSGGCFFIVCRLQTAWCVRCAARAGRTLARSWGCTSWACTPPTSSTRHPTPWPPSSESRWAGQGERGGVRRVAAGALCLPAVIFR